MLKEGYSRRKTLISKTRLSPAQEANIDMRNKIISISTIVTVLFFLSVGNIFAELEKIEIGVEGLSCSFCAWGLEKKLKKIKSIEKVNIHLKQAKAEILLKPNTPLNIASIKKAIKEAGFSTGYIYIVAIGNLVKKKDQILFYIKGTEQEFLVYEYETDTMSEAKLLEIVKPNVTIPIRIEGKIHEHKEIASSLGIEKIELLR